MADRTLMIGVIVAGLLTCGAGTSKRPAGKGEGVKLTDRRPTAILPIPPGVLRQRLPILEVPVNSVQNEKRTPFAIFVYLVWKEGRPGPTKQRNILVGNFVVFPPDHPGRYTLRVSRAFGDLEKQGKNLVRLQPGLQFELRRLRQKAAWGPIEVTIGPVRWLKEGEAGEGSP